MQLWHENQAKVTIMFDRVQFSAPARYVETVKESITAVIAQFVSDMVPIEHEIKDAKKIKFIDLNKVAVRAFCT
jgi:septum formation topological specificity factor MinE